MKTIKAEPENFASNTYILTEDCKTAIIIDPSELRILEVLKKEGLAPGFVLLTHGHFDHVGACGELFARGAVICCGVAEKEFIFSPENRNICPGADIPDFEIAKTFSDGERFSLCGMEFTAISTPGHTAGSMCYICGGNLFSGDTLFRRGIGRTDLPGGDFGDIKKSLKKLFSLSGDYAVYPGHGENSTLDFERRYNPYVK